MGRSDLLAKAGRLSAILKDALTLPLLDRPGILHGFGTKNQTEEGIKAALNGAPVLRLKQIHGDTVVSVGEGGEQDITHAQGDALISNRHGVFIAVSTADCVPILIVDAERRAIAAIHAGWRGTVRGIAAKTVSAMIQTYHLQTVSLFVGIGPGIGRCCFEVGREVWQEIEKKYPYGAETVTRKEGDKAHLDLARLNRLQLLDVGVPADQIAEVGLCTVCHPGLFYSYRRDKSKVRNMISGVMLR